jgi:hypothetical protein
MEGKSNLNISSNLMLYDESYPPEDGNYKHFPGDLIAIVMPWLTDKRAIDSELTSRQIEEYDRYLVCITCNKTCAGTCSLNS